MLPLSSLLQASQLRRFAAYFDVGKPLWQPKKAWMDMLAYDWDQLFKQGIAGESVSRPQSPQSDAAQRMYIVSPIDGQLQYLRRGKNVRQGEAEAIQEADFHLQSITFHVSSMCTQPMFVCLWCIQFLGMCCSVAMAQRSGTVPATVPSLFNHKLIQCVDRWKCLHDMARGCA